jgi:LacI family transcriptional regulator
MPAKTKRAKKRARKTSQSGRPTMVDLAKAAGVSVATVSRVLNDQPGASEATAARIWRTVDRLHYEVNHVAKSLRMGATHTIAVMVYDLANPFYADFIKGVESAAHRAGRSVLVCDVAAGPAERTSVMRRQLQMLISKRVDGLIINGSLLSSAQLRRLLENRIEVTVVGLPKRAPRDVRTVTIDFLEGMHQVVAHLSSLGHDRIASIQLRGYDERVARSRYRDLQEALAEAGLPYPKKWVGWVDTVDDVAAGRAAVRRLLKRAGEFTAVVGHNDMMAIGALQAAREAGLRVPEDLSVVGIDDIFASSLVHPPLTTLALPRMEIGEIAVSSLLGDGATTRRAVVRPQLVVRGSTGPARRA